MSKATPSKDGNGITLQQTDTTYDDLGHITSNTVQDAITGQGRSTNWRYVYSSQRPWHVEKMTVTGPRSDITDATEIEYWPHDATCPGNGIGEDKGCRGKIKSITNALQHVTLFEGYDAHGRATRIRNPNNSQTVVSYSARGWIKSLTVNGETTTYEHDGVGNLKKVTLPDGAVLNYHHDAANRLTGMSDNLGNSISYVLDNMGNRVSEVVKDQGGSIKRQISRVYNNLNRLIKTTGAAQ
jgi:YD repeat-containing protein